MPFAQTVSLTLVLLVQLIAGAFVFPLLCLRGSCAAGHESSVGVDLNWLASRCMCHSLKR